MSGTDYVDTVYEDGCCFYRVYPYFLYGEGISPGDSDAYVCVFARAPRAVTNLKARGNPTSVTVSWTAAEFADGYIICRQAPGETKRSCRKMATNTSIPAFNRFWRGLLTGPAI